MKMFRHFLAIVFICIVAHLFAQQEIDYPKLGIYLDCSDCENAYLQESLIWVNFVRNQEDADVYVMVRIQPTGSGGANYEMEVSGQKDYKHINNHVVFSTLPNSTTIEKREIIQNNLMLALSPFFNQLAMNWSKTRSKDSTKVEQTIVRSDQKDKWNSWVFNLGLNGSLSGEESSNRSSLRANIAAKRVTEKNKFSFRADIDTDRSEFRYGETKIIAKNQSKNVEISDVISLGQHWSAGAFLKTGSSDYFNLDFSFDFKPAIEYNFFPYKESSKKQLTLSYRVGFVYNDYKEKTVFLKHNEVLWENSLNLGASVHQKWGSLSGEISYDSYLDDVSLHAVDFSLFTNIRVFKGLSVNFSANYQITNNQINLTAGDLSLDELLLRQQQLKSGYNFFVSWGISYSFGSMYNAIVNPRFGF